MRLFVIVLENLSTENILSTIELLSKFKERDDEYPHNCCL